MFIWIMNVRHQWWGYVSYDSATTHTIFKNNKLFSYLVIWEVNVSTIFGTTNIIEGSRRATVLLPRGTRLHIKFQGYLSKWISYWDK